MNSNRTILIVILLLVVALGLSIFNAIQVQKLNANFIYLKDKIEERSNATPLSKQEQFVKELNEIQPKVGATAQDFVLYDQNNKAVSLEDIKKPKILLIFSSALCDTCKEFYPYINQFDSQNPEEVAVLVLQTESSVTDNKKMLSDNQYNFTILDAGAPIFEAYQVISTPTSVLIDTQSQQILKIGDLFDYHDIVSFVK
ncbi:redoxin family protein [Aquimarina sp. ERC-38]|uniref:TlpA family protein disulfide reductase n=1 Tax=Aquimarina sp. ERC-38 TaxID=2949996 RepID=UPI0022476E4C|nr:redoxin family protein [Aquimarina sp. ERC-38]UZO81565.1 redoxin family protein [Aquimarina sp. ERC-38]